MSEHIHGLNALFRQSLPATGVTCRRRERGYKVPRTTLTSPGSVSRLVGLISHTNSQCQDLCMVGGANQASDISTRIVDTHLPSWGQFCHSFTPEQLNKALR